MEYVHLGRTGTVVSRLCLGTMNFGPHTDETESFGIMNKAFEEGINFFDTANIYGGKNVVGVSEEIVGKWFTENRDKRDKIVLATKVFGPMGSGPNERHLGAVHLRKACEDSLRRLKTDHIDLYQFHHIDRQTPWEELWQEMERLVQSGKVIYVGSSNFAGWHIAHAQGIARSRHFLGLVCEQSVYNLAKRTVELEVLPACRELGLGFIAWSPLAGGALAGLTDTAGEAVRRKGGIAEPVLKKLGSSLEAYGALCKQNGLNPAELALAWLLSNKTVTAPIIGPRTSGQLESALRSLSLKLSDDLKDELDSIWPGPGGEAPEAYAW
jgi:aryl-alcohol dehydrogenase-like predicted oxidoreductase